MTRSKKATKSAREAKIQKRQLHKQTRQDIAGIKSISSNTRAAYNNIGAPRFTNGGLLMPSDILAPHEPPNPSEPLHMEEFHGHARSSLAPPVEPDPEPVDSSMSEDEVVFQGKDPKARLAALAESADSSDWSLRHQKRKVVSKNTPDSTDPVVLHTPPVQQIQDKPEEQQEAEPQYIIELTRNYLQTLTTSNVQTEHTTEGRQAVGALVPKDELINLDKRVSEASDAAAAVNIDIRLEERHSDEDDEDDEDDEEDEEDAILRDYMENMQADSDAADDLALKNPFVIRDLDIGEWEDMGPSEEFDVMDYDRVSLQKPKKKSKGKLVAVPQISDEELQEKLNNAWENDRSKKRERKLQREELRKQGLLKRHKSKSVTEDLSDDDKSESGDAPDLNLKYPIGMYTDDLWDELEEWCYSDRTILALPPFDANIRKLIHTIVDKLGLKSKSHGKGTSRYLVITKSNRSYCLDDKIFNRCQRFIKSPFLSRQDVGAHQVVPPRKNRAARATRRAIGGGGRAVTAVRAGDKIGEGAEELHDARGSAKARAMMEKMGWSAGQGLGQEGKQGIVNPLEQVVWASRAGLG